MATQVKRRRGTTAENDNFTGALAEFTFDTETHHIRVHDGVKQGGYVIPVITDPLNPGKYTKVTIDDQGLVIGAEPLSVDDLPNEIPMDKVFGLPLALENKQDKIYAGENIVIDETTISAIDTKYTAGEGIFISPNNVISSLTSGVSFDDIIVKSATMPAPEDVSLGSIYMYIGETNTEFVHGYIYQNVKQDNLVVWERMDVQPGGEVSFANLIGQPEDNAALKQELDSKQNVLTAGIGIEITENNIINNTQTSAEWGNITGTLSDQTDLQSALDDKQDVIDDLEEIRSNAESGAEAATTISSYGDIVTHNANEFQIAGDYATKTELNQKQDTISDLEDIRSNAQAGKDIIPQVETNTQRIEDLTVARFPNVVIVGTPHIEGGQVSNYSDTSYLQFPFVDISRGQPFDIYFSFTTAADVTTQQNILDAHFGIALAIQNGKGIMALSSNGTSWDIGTAVGTNALLPNTTYYVKYSWTGTEYSAALSTDDTEYVPDMNLTSSLSPYKTTIFIGGSPNLFGPASAHPFKGTINFNKSKVVVNGITVWEGMADVGLASRANVSLNNLDEVGEARFTEKQDVTDNNLITASKTVTGAINEVKSKVDSMAASKFPNAVVIGDLTINHGQITGFSQTSYLAMPFMFNTQNKGFEFHYAFRTNETDVTTPQNLFGSKFCIASYVSAGKLRIRISNNGTSWDALDIETSLNVQANTTYYIKLESNLLSYTISASTDGVAYNQIGYQVTTLQPKPGDVFIGIGNNNNNPFLGMIDLNKWWLKIAGETIWEGMGESGLSTRADISLSNLDEEGQAQVDSTKNQNEASDIDRLCDWVGTLEEYNEQQIETLHPEWMVYITDDVIGGESVYTKSEVDAALNEKANKATTLSGYGITDAYTKTENDDKFIATDRITNCITEIPQDIKLETVSDGTTRIKAGSKVYIPNGPGVFNTVTIPRNITIAFMGGVAAYLQYAVFVKQDGSGTYTEVWSSCYSGATQPSVLGGSYWYDTANNVMKYSSGGTTWTNANCSLPVAIVTVLNGKIKSIDQVFNGFGYLDSTVFALPGVKGLIPNGRNADGTLKNIEFTTSSVLTNTGGFNEHQQWVILRSDNVIQGWDSVDWIGYNSQENILFNKEGSSSATSGSKIAGCVCAFLSANVNQKITSFAPKTAFRALDYNDSEYIAHQAMPSGRYINLTLGTSGANYTAPADGYIVFHKMSNAAGQRIGLIVNTGARNIIYSSGANQYMAVTIPVQKGNVATIYHTAGGETSAFRFVYAEGSK